jgi:16S rRNA (uracil1498-N3)-methyltransferase
VVRHLPGLPESPLAVTLAVGLAKGEALEEVVRRATEMGVSRLTPFVCQRSERPTPGRGLRRLERWRRLARESLKSCRRAVLPVIDPVQDLADVLAGPEELKIMFWEEQEAGGLAALLARPRPAGVRLLIGPEGGFSAGEAAQAKEAGFLVASLGPRALKVPTAAMTALALVQFAWGDLA